MQCTTLKAFLLLRLNDTAAALYTDFANPPGIVFYDCACSACEYVNNRECAYFRNTRFFQDVFHGFLHKCSFTVRSSSLNGIEQTNTSISEQFDSFIQHIKSPAKLLGRPHFTYYLCFLPISGIRCKMQTMKSQAAIEIKETCAAVRVNQFIYFPDRTK